MSNSSRKQARHGVVILLLLVTLLTTASAAVGADTTRPSTPKGLTATAIYSTQVTLSWRASTDNVGVAGYNVRRNDVIVGTSSTTSFTDTGLTPRTPYKYRVQAFDAAGNVSAFSSRIGVRTNTTAPPSTGTNAPTAPAGLTASAASSSQIKLAWSAATGNVGVAGYQVFRNGGMVNTTTNLSYMDTGLAASTNYTYTVRAFDAAGDLSQTSNTASATTLAAPPPPDTSPPTAPAGLSASAISSSQINLSWLASSDNIGVAGYAIFRNSSQIATTGSLSYNNSGLSASTTYSYTVKAYDAAGNVSAASASATATTQATPPPTSGSFWIAPTGNDSNPGTQAAPWRTIQKAANTLTAGQTAILMDGTYESGEIVFRTSGTASARITIIAQNKWQAIISSTSSCQPNISIFASYITIQDIRFTVSPNNVTCANLQSNIPAAIRAWQGTLPNASNPNSTYAGFVARGVYIDYSPAMALGIKTSMDNSLVENCEIHNSLEDMADHGTIFRNNVLYARDVFGSTITAKGGSRSFQAYNNVIHMTMPSEGLVLGGTSGTQWDFDPATAVECYNCVAYNNVVINETGNLNYPVLIMAGCQDCTFLNNVGINGPIHMRGGGGSTTTSPNPTWKNNILSCNGAQARTTWNGSGTVTVDYNDFYNCGSPPSQTHTIVGDPKFVDPSSDWHLQPGSPALGSGVEVHVFGYNGEVLDVSRNKDGDVRTVPWNLGIY